MPVSVICFVQLWQWGRWRAVFYQWPATLHRMTFFDGRPISSCEKGWGIQNPIVWFRLRERERERVRQTIFLMSSLSLRTVWICTPQCIFCCLFSYKALLMSPQICQFPRGYHRLLCPVLQHSQRGHGSIRSSWVPSALHFHPEETMLSHETLRDKKNDEVWLRFLSGQMFLNHFVTFGNRSDLHDIASGQRSPSEA